ncbi:MAG TPA: hypothetical protein VJ123_03195 [Anaerolineales bacterium]|nr:hypothetical protein [Anaerolineales bacterium]
MPPIQPDDLILVAVVKGRRDLEIARLLGWYRIPVQTAPKVLRVDWLALYQTAAFGEEKWRVRHVAPVRGYELATRAELLREESDHPRAREPYFKMQLGPLETLARPIPASRWRRFTFLYTTGERLLAAGDLTDLTLHSVATRESLWRLLRERAG